MVKNGSPKNGQEADDVAAIIERAIIQAKRVRKSRRTAVPLPDVDPDAPGLDQLLAWGEAVAEMGDITPERSRKLLAALRKSMDEDSSGR